MFDEQATSHVDAERRETRARTRTARRPASRPGTTAGHRTPQPAQPADIVGRRVGAYIIDLLLINVGLAFAGAVSGLVPATAEGLEPGHAYRAALVSAAVTLLYFAVTETAFRQTIGKRLLRCAVEMADGSRPRLHAVVIRRVPFVIGLTVPTLGPLLFVLVPLAALVTAIQDSPTVRGFHDRLAGTRVVEA